MTAPDAPALMSAAEAAEALAQGGLDAVTLTDACLRRIAADACNAWLHVDAEGALAQARASDERRAKGRAYHPLDGIPVAVKDNIAVAGMPLTTGMQAHRGRVAVEDAHCVAKLRRAGAVILGKTHLCEGALGADSDNPHYGRCLNPRVPGASAGGSSSGSAAALAAHQCLLALGSDSMGSVRIPAAYCGVVGLKPSAARVSTRGLVTASRRLDHIGPMARRMADLSAVFQQISGLDLHDPASRLVPLAHVERDPAQLRVGVLGGLEALGVRGDVIAGFEQAVARLAGLLPRRQAVSFADADLTRWRRAGFLLMEAEMCQVHAQVLAQQPDSLSPALRELLAFPATRSAVDLAGALHRLDEAVLYGRQLFVGLDVLLMPTTPQSACDLGTALPANQADLTALANFAGLPALSLPMGTAPGGRPLGLQLMGPVGSDLQLMALGERIETLLAG